MSTIKETSDPTPADGKGGFSFLHQLWASVAATVVLTVICCGLYPLAVWAVAQAVFPHQANGSLLKKDGSKSRDDTDVVGSSLIGQVFTDPRYFHPRPSAANNSPGNNTTTTANLDQFSPTGGYDPTSSGGSNFGPLSDTLINGATGTGPAPDAPTPAPTTAPAPEHLFYDGIRLRTLHYARDNGISFKLYNFTPAGVKTEVPLSKYSDSSGNLNDIALVDAFPHPPADATLKDPRDVLVAGDFKTPDGKPVLIPADAVTASASGLDPHITPANADLQAPRVAAQRKITLKQVQDLIAQNTDGAGLGFLGDPGVNVVKLNIALDTQYPVKPEPTTQPAK